MSFLLELNWHKPLIFPKDFQHAWELWRKTSLPKTAKPWLALFSSHCWFFSLQPSVMTCKSSSNLTRAEWWAWGFQTLTTVNPVVSNLHAKRLTPQSPPNHRKTVQSLPRNLPRVPDTLSCDFWAAMFWVFDTRPQPLAFPLLCLPGDPYLRLITALFVVGLDHDCVQLWLIRWLTSKFGFIIIFWQQTDQATVIWWNWLKRCCVMVARCLPAG